MPAPKKLLSTVRIDIGEDKWTDDYDLVNKDFTARMNSVPEMRWDNLYLPEPYAPCTTPLQNLKPMTILQIAPGHHRGRYLLLRVLVAPIANNSISLLAEDENHDIVDLKLYHQGDDVWKGGDMAEIGRVLLVREPFRTVLSGQPMLVVDHPSDVMRVLENNALYPQQWASEAGVSLDFEALKLEGDAAVSASRFWKAIEKYAPYVRYNIND